MTPGVTFESLVRYFNSFANLGPPKANGVTRLVSTKALLRKHYYRRQGLNRVHAKGVAFCERSCFCLLSTL